MKFTSILVGMALIASPALADGEKPLNSSMCPAFGSIAKGAMTRRQNNDLMSDIIQELENKLGKDDAFFKFGKAIVLQAYNRPLFISKENKDRAINDFANEMMKVCYSDT